MSIRTVPRHRSKPVSTVTAFIREEKEQFFFELQSVIEIAGGYIPIEALKEMTIGEVIDSLYTNEISFELRPIMHSFPFGGSEEHLESIREVTARAQDAKQRATQRHAEFRRNS